MESENKMLLIVAVDGNGNTVDYFKTNNNRPEEVFAMAIRFTMATGGKSFHIFRMK